MLGTPGFVGARLTQAREARGLSAVALAELLELQSPSVSNYEHGRQSPSPYGMSRLLDVLKLPHPFFLRPMPAHDEVLWYRSMSSATKLARARAAARHSWLREIIAYLSEYVDFPEVRIPTFELPGDIHDISTQLIEDIAAQCREFWNLGNSPIADIVLLLENNGVILSRGNLGAETLDAYSQRPRDFAHPIIFLGNDKASAVRSRHDASHELGHLILHGHVNANSIRNAQHFKLMEDQAHRFAAAFNLPAQGFAEQLWTPSLDAFLALKPHWKVSIGAMIVRCAQLGILSDEQMRRAWINMSRKGWRTCEPLDDRLVPERPRLLRRSFELLLKEGIKSRDQIIADLCLNAHDVESLACLDPGFLTGDSDDPTVLPQLRQDLFVKTGTSNVLNFASRRNSN